MLFPPSPTARYARDFPGFYLRTYRRRPNFLLRWLICEENARGGEGDLGAGENHESDEAKGEDKIAKKKAVREEN